MKSLINSERVLTSPGTEQPPEVPEEPLVEGEERRGCGGGGRRPSAAGRFEQGHRRHDADAARGSRRHGGLHAASPPRQTLSGRPGTRRQTLQGAGRRWLHLTAPLFAPGGGGKINKTFKRPISE